MSTCPRCGEPTRRAVWLAQGDGTARLSHRRRGGARCEVVLPLTAVLPGHIMVPERTGAVLGNHHASGEVLVAIGVRADGAPRAQREEA